MDDELPGLTYLKMICEQVPGVEVVRAFNDSRKFLQESSQLDFDLCILDIEMPGLNGLEVARLLAGKPVIFTTAYKEYAAEAFDLNAIDYIRKPIQKERLEQAFQKAEEKLKLTDKQFVQLNTSLGRSLLFFDHILYITTAAADKRDKLALMENGDELLLKNISFSQLQTLLPTKHFCQINKKEMVALKQVSFFSHDEITCAFSKGGKPFRLILSPAYKTEFIQKISG